MVIDDENNHLERERQRKEEIKAAKRRQDSEREILSSKPGDIIVQRRLERISDRNKQRKCDISYLQQPR